VQRSIHPNALPIPSVTQVPVADLASCRDLRHRVFVVEQGVPEALEVDGLDASCVHFAASHAGIVVATARLRIVDGRPKAERVAVAPEWRRRGLGGALMRALEACATAGGFSELRLSSQASAFAFYQRLGYRALGAPFVEAGIEHVRMHKRLSS